MQEEAAGLQAGIARIHVAREQQTAWLHRLRCTHHQAAAAVPQGGLYGVSSSREGDAWLSKRGSKGAAVEGLQGGSSGNAALVAAGHGSNSSSSSDGSSSNTDSSSNTESSSNSGSSKNRQEAAADSRSGPTSALSGGRSGSWRHHLTQSHNQSTAARQTTGRRRAAGAAAGQEGLTAQTERRRAAGPAGFRVSNPSSAAGQEGLTAQTELRLAQQSAALDTKQAALAVRRSAVDDAAVDSELRVLAQLSQAQHELAVLGSRREDVQTQFEVVSEARYCCLLSVLQRLNDVLSDVYRELSGGGGDAHIAYTPVRVAHHLVVNINRAAAAMLLLPLLQHHCMAVISMRAICTRILAGASSAVHPRCYAARAARWRALAAVSESQRGPAGACSTCPQLRTAEDFPLAILCL
jgi:hypothetical protein